MQLFQNHSLHLISACFFFFFKQLVVLCHKITFQNNFPSLSGFMGGVIVMKQQNFAHLILSDIFVTHCVIAFLIFLEFESVS